MRPYCLQCAPIVCNAPLAECPVPLDLDNAIQVWRTGATARLIYTWRFASTTPHLHATLPQPTQTAAGWSRAHKAHALWGHAGELIYPLFEICRLTQVTQSHGSRRYIPANIGTKYCYCLAFCLERLYRRVSSRSGPSL